MPVEHLVDKTGIMHIRRWGNITTRDEDTALRKRQKDLRVLPGIPVIVDCREVEPPDSTELINHIAAMISSLIEGPNCGSVAIVVDSDVEYGMARMFTALTALTHPNTEVFRSYDEALEWVHRQSDQCFQSVSNL